MILLVFAVARAAGVDVDVELVRPTLAPGSVPGVDSPDATDSGAVRVGGTVMFLTDPVVLYSSGEPLGSVVKDRVSGLVGVEVGVARWIALRASLPVYAQWGSEVAEWSADGPALGDLSVGARVAAYQGGPLSLGARLDLDAPTSTPNAWAGERSLRAQPGLLVGLDQGNLAVRVDASALLRAGVDTSADLALGPELALAGAVRYDVAPVISPWVGVTSRVPFSSANHGSGGVEALAGVQLHAGSSLQIDALAGTGLADGYGTSKVRVGVGVTWSHAPAREATPVEVAQPEHVVDKQKLLEDLPDTVIQGTREEEPPPVVVPQVAAARIVAQQIVIRDPIQFERGTEKILPESAPTLAAISALLAEHPEILELIVEGHSSDEGSFAYNYDLSIRRSLAVYRALVEAGVHPDRLSCRGVGEVAPSVAGESETDLAANRRVIFRIARQWQPGDPFVPWSDSVVLPWTGATQKVVPPPEGFGQPPPEPPKPMPETTSPTTFQEGDDP